MKLCLTILFACVVGAYCGAADVAARAKAGDAQRAWRRQQGANQDWENADQKSGQVNQDWDQQANSASSDRNSAAQNWGKASSSWNTNRDAANRAGNKAAANNAARDGKAQWSASNNYDKNQDWSRNGGWKNTNRRHESIGYAFDKSHNRNANDNGGFDAGSSLADRAVDDQGERSSSYDRRQSDHAARAANADAQSADRSAGFGNGAWRQAGASDRNNRDWRQSAGANANSRDWAEKRDSSQNANTLHGQQRSRAADALVDRADVDRDANRASQAHGNAVGVNRPYGGKGYGYGRPAGYGYNGVGRGYGRNGAASDASRVSDRANHNRQQNWAGNNWEDRTKDAASRDQWQSDSVQGFNRDRAATLWDQGAAANAAQRGQGARAADRQWADAKAAKAANQARHDFDETDWKNANQKWNKADRDHKRKEWKKFFSNDKTGGENTERLWYDRNQNDDHAAADFGNQRDNSARWQDAHNYDSRAQRAHGNDYATANEARNRYWDQDSSRDANARDQQRAAAADAASRGRWGADNDNRDYKVDQSRSDASSRFEQNHDRDAQRRGHGAYRGLGARAGPVGYGVGYGAGYGNRGYGAGYGAGYGKFGAGYGNGYGANGYYGYGAPFNNKYGGGYY